MKFSGTSQKKTFLPQSCSTELGEKDSKSRTATEMDGTLHTDFRKSETSRDIKKISNII